MFVWIKPKHPEDMAAEQSAVAEAIRKYINAVIIGRSRP